MQEMVTYKLRFWYWHQEITITGITADELIQSLLKKKPQAKKMKTIDNKMS